MKSMRKTRPQDKPYEVWTDLSGVWTWKVLKFYRSKQATIEDEYGRVLCLVTSPHTIGSGDLGDVYYREIRRNAFLVETNYPPEEGTDNIPV